VRLCDRAASYRNEPAVQQEMHLRWLLCSLRQEPKTCLANSAKTQNTVPAFRTCWQETRRQVYQRKGALWSLKHRAAERAATSACRAWSSAGPGSTATEGQGSGGASAGAGLADLLGLGAEGGQPGPAQSAQESTGEGEAPGQGKSSLGSRGAQQAAPAPSDVHAMLRQLGLQPGTPPVSHGTSLLDDDFGPGVTCEAGFWRSAGMLSEGKGGLAGVGASAAAGAGWNGLAPRATGPKEEQHAVNATDIGEFAELNPLSEKKVL
jgi:hypothetical protein